MCGIAGLIDFNKNSSQEILQNCTDSMVHRGPDGAGYWWEEAPTAQIGFGHRRLAIIDLTEGGKQPMTYKNFTVCFNGEIYNYEEIKETLSKAGHTFQSHSDTEMILHAFEEWGMECLDKFIGMFAFAIYNSTTQKIFFARDRAGVKPFYYYWENGTFLFSSELKAFHPHSAFKKEIDLDSLAMYFQYGYIPVPHAIFKHTFKLKQGHFLTLDLVTKEISENKYWDVNDAYKKPTLKISESEAKAETEKVLRKAFKYRMVADVPVGVFLSGGYDSSAVTALLQTDMTDQLKTFSIGFHEQGFDEAPHAKKVAKHLGTDHTEYYCTQAEAKEILPTLPFFYDEPFGDSSAIPTMLVSKLARKKVTVALSADAGDEVFAGYERYPYLLKINSLKNKIPAFAMRGLAGMMGAVNPSVIPVLNKNPLLELRYEKIRKILACDKSSELLRSMSVILDDKEVAKLFKNKFHAKPTYFDEQALEQEDMLHQLLAKDYKTYMQDDILTKVDRATMSVSLEGREPFLDHHIIEWVAQLPTDLKIRNGVKKYLLREIVHDYIPKEMMDRPKMGFGVPIKAWFQDELAAYFQKYLSKDFIEKQGILDAEIIQKWLASYNHGRTEYIHHLWYALMFQMWYEHWM